MKAILCSLLPALLCLRTVAQATYEPQVLILAPGNIQIEKGFEGEIARLNDAAKAHRPHPSVSEQEEMRKQPENIQRMVTSETAFFRDMNFAKQASFISEQFLAYKFSEKFPNLLILLKDTQSNGKLDDLRKMAEGAGLQYVLNFPSLSFFKEGGGSHARLAVQLYDHGSNTLLIDTAFVGDWDNPGFEFACESGTLSCTINNSVSQALDRVVEAVVTNSPTVKRERQLWQERLQVVRTEYYRSFDNSIVQDAVPNTDSTIVEGHLYQLLVSKDRQKFVAFFLEKTTGRNFKSLAESKGDNDVQVLSSKKITDSGYLDAIPSTYAYIVKAVKYQGKWYYEKSNATYFEPQDGEGGRLQYFNSVQDWGFFQGNSSIISEDFWETHLFEKVKDLRKDPDWDKYGKTIWKQEEEENRPYIGMYQIVADRLKGPSAFQPKKIRMN
jgi:hypothetical protein